MSHWVKLKMKVTNQQSLEAALNRMGFNYTTGNFTITQYGTSEKAEIKLDNSVGFSQQQDGTWAMVGDFYHSGNSKLRSYYGRNAQFEKDLNTAYAIEDTAAKLADQHFYCVENEEGLVGQDGLIRMVFEKI